MYQEAEAKTEFLHHAIRELELAVYAWPRVFIGAFLNSAVRPPCSGEKIRDKLARGIKEERC